MCNCRAAGHWMASRSFPRHGRGTLWATRCPRTWSLQRRDWSYCVKRRSGRRNRGTGRKNNGEELDRLGEKKKNFWKFYSATVENIVLRRLAVLVKKRNGVGRRLVWGVGVFTYFGDWRGLSWRVGPVLASWTSQAGATAKAKLGPHDSLRI
jgi:hypothetical protein